MPESEYLSMKLNQDEATILKKNSQGLQRQRCLLKKQEVMNKFDEIEKNIDSDIEYNSFYKIHSPDR